MNSLNDLEKLKVLKFLSDVQTTNSRPYTMTNSGIQTAIDELKHEVTENSKL